MSMRCSFALLLAGAALAFGVQSASATIREVETTGTCLIGNYPTYTTIQSAVSASNKGDTVDVCPGTYPEQVFITKAMTLAGIPVVLNGTTYVPVVAAPAGGIVQNGTRLNGSGVAAQILVQPTVAGNVTVKNLTVDGTGNNITGCVPYTFVGIYYQNAGGTISGNTTQYQMQDPADLGCQNGLGIFVESNALGTGKVTITGNTVDNFQKNGITLHLGAATGTISKNAVTGIGPTTAIAQNGIEVAYGATATILGNSVSQIAYTGLYYPATLSSGILLYGSQATGSPTYPYLTPPSVTGNTITSSQVGVALDAVDGTSNSMVKLASNNITGSYYGIQLVSDPNYSPPLSDDYINVLSNHITNTGPADGIDACSDYNAITGNTITNATESAIHLDSTPYNPNNGAGCEETDGSPSGSNNTVSSNHMVVACVGVLDGGTGNVVNTNNHYTDVTHDYETGNSYSCSPAHHSGKTGTSKTLGVPQPLHP